MIEFAQNFEAVAHYFHPVLLVIPALVGLMVGLLVWLAGLNLRKILLGAVAAVSIGILALALSYDVMVGFFGLLFGLIGGVVFEKSFTVCLAAVLGSATAFAVIIGPVFIADQQPVVADEYQTVEHQQTLDTQQSGQYMQAYLDALAAGVGESSKTLSSREWATLAVVGVLSALGAVFLRVVVLSAAFSLVGTILLFSSMAWLLLYKGSAPISYILENLEYFGAVFATMTVFGMLCQIMLCHWPAGNSAKKPVKNSPKEKE